MGLRTPEQYKESLRDGRAVYLRGEKVADVTKDPVIGIAVEHACIDYRMAEDPKYRGLAVMRDGGGEYSRYFHLPRNSDDLLKRSELIAASTREGATLVVLIKEIGTDALYALHILGERMAAAGKPEYRERVAKYHRYCRDNDLAVAVAQTDVKGDRSLGPTAQDHPDYYVRVVEERPDGIVVRGAKVHTSVSTNTNEVIVLPTRAMRAEDKAYAVAFALPINTPGLKLIASPHGSSHKNQFEHPLSAGHKMMETLTVFDDVFVPKERVFLNGEIDFAGLLALTFVRYHRFTAVSYKLPLLELMAGAGYAIAEANGVLRAAHVRDKLTHLAAYHATVRGLIEHAAADLHYRGRPRGAQHAAHQRRQVSLRAQLPSGGADRAGPRGRAAGDGAGGRGPDQRGDARVRAEVHGRRQGLRRREAASAAQSDRRPDGVGLRRLPGGAGGARRGRLRGGEAAGLPRVRFQNRGGLRAQAGGSVSGGDRSEESRGRHRITCRRIFDSRQRSGVQPRPPSLLIIGLIPFHNTRRVQYI